MKLRNLSLLFLLTLLLACQKNEDIDTEKPTIYTAYTEVFPSYCDTIYFGEPFELKAHFIDNNELGRYSVDVHNNFDHHSHGHKIEACSLDDIKDPVNPFVLLESFELPTGQKEHKISQTMTIPTGDDNGLYDEGDYHFQIFLVDIEGWSTPLGLSVKLLHRKN